MDPVLADVLKTLFIAGAPVLAAFVVATLNARHESDRRLRAERETLYVDAIAFLEGYARSADHLAEMHELFDYRASDDRPMSEWESKELSDNASAAERDAEENLGRLRAMGPRIIVHGSEVVRKAFAEAVKVMPDPEASTTLSDARRAIFRKAVEAFGAAVRKDLRQ